MEALLSTVTTTVAHDVREFVHEGVEPLFATVTASLAQDVRELVHAAELEEPAVIEKDPPNWHHWRVPLGFVTVAAIGALLIAAGGVQQEVQQQTRSAKRHAPTRMHKKRVRPQSAPLPRPAS
jgi:hypothetical protein